MNAWFDYAATLKILIFGLLAGAALPALFALGVRLRATGTGEMGRRSHPAPTVLSWAIFALVLVAVLAGVLFIARDFIADQLA
jgi:hypothetical protein